MDDKLQQSLNLTVEEVAKLTEIAKPFWEEGVSQNPPQLVILTGGVASGKTTMRRQKFNDGYVQFEYGDVYTAVKKAINADEEKLLKYAFFASNLILKESLTAKKNIVTEIIGDNKALISPIIDGIIKKGYKVSVNYVSSDPIEAYKRHLIAVKEDKDYWSAYFTQESTLLAFYQQLGLQVPLNDD